MSLHMLDRHPKLVLLSGKPVRGDLEAAPVGVYDVIRDDVRLLSTVKPVDSIHIERSNLGYRGILYSNERPFAFTLNGNGFQAKPYDDDPAVLRYIARLDDAEREATAKIDARRSDDDIEEFNAEMLMGSDGPSVTAIAEDAPRETIEQHGPMRDFIERVPGMYRGAKQGGAISAQDKTGGICGGAIVLNKDGRILLVKPTNGWGGYDWTFPKGHPTAADGHPSQTAVRETHEETGYVVVPKRHVGRFTHNDGGCCEYTLCDVDGTKPVSKYDEKETEEVRWVSLTQALELLNDDVDVKILAQANQLSPKLLIKSDGHSGTMIALYLPTAIAKKVALPGGEPASSMHITLAYLGKGLSDLEKRRVAAVTQQLAESCATIKARLGGVGRFSASETSEGRDVVYISVDSPDITDLRPHLVKMLSAVDIKPNQEHGFVPHVTLMYIDQAKRTPIERFEPIDVTFTELSLSIADKTTAVPLRLQKAIVKNPGKRGGKFYRDDKGEIQYGERPVAKPTLAGVKAAIGALALGISTGITEGGGLIHLGKIAVPKELRGSGIGTKAMQILLDYADHTGQKIVLTPSTDFGASSVSRLQDFYKRFGFVANKGRNKDWSTRETMYREAQVRKSTLLLKSTHKRVMKPGSHGAPYWIDDMNNVRYDPRPAYRKPKTDATQTSIYKHTNKFGVRFLRTDSDHEVDGDAGATVRYAPFGKNIEGLSQGEVHFIFTELFNSKAKTMDGFLNTSVKPVWDDKDGTEPYTIAKARAWMDNVLTYLEYDNAIAPGAKDLLHDRGDDVDWDQVSKAVENLPDSYETGSSRDSLVRQKIVREAFRTILHHFGITKPPNDIDGMSDRICASETARILGTDVRVAAFHDWRGGIFIRTSTALKTLKQFCKDMASDTGKVSDDMTLNGITLLLHEQLHGFSDMGPPAYQGLGAYVEEVATEVSARMIVRERFGHLRNMQYGGGTINGPGVMARGDEKLLQPSIYGGYGEIIQESIHAVAHVLASAAALAGVVSPDPVAYHDEAKFTLEQACLRLKQKKQRKPAQTPAQHVKNFIACFDSKKWTPEMRKLLARNIGIFYKHRTKNRRDLIG